MTTIPTIDHSPDRISNRYPIVDVDSHVTEPPDLWTSRLPARFADRGPTVVWDERRQEERWRIGDRMFTGVAGFATAGWTEFPPGHPRSLEDADPASWNAADRLTRLTEYGVTAQVLYPNLLGFGSHLFIEIDDLDLRLACVQAYNDFLAEFCSADRRRLIPIMFLPFWDIDAARAEMARGHELGHAGIVFGSDFEKIGLPGITDEHWAPLLADAEERGLSINFHIGFSSSTEELKTATTGNAATFARNGSLMMLGNVNTVVALIAGGVCHRHPDLRFVSVESGLGWIPFVLQSVDWQWTNSGAHLENPDMLLPSEYFARQVYGSFWFETGIDAVLDRMQDNAMYETDFPHPTSMSPGPASFADVPSDFVESNLSTIPAPVLEKVLFRNACTVYGIDEDDLRSAQV